MKQIILASTSPRRKELMEKLQIPFTIEDSQFEEDMTLDLVPEELAKYLSKGKADNIAANYPDAIIIAGDSLVAFEGKSLGKPHTPEKAREMLHMLKGKKSTIITGVTIIDVSSQKTVTFTTITDVYLKDISSEEIDVYIATGEPLDKAGSFAIQGLGAVFVEKMDGDFYGAVGLPLSRLADELKHFGVHVLAEPTQ